MLDTLQSSRERVVEVVIHSVCDVHSPVQLIVSEGHESNIIDEARRQGLSYVGGNQAYPMVCKRTFES